MTGELQGTLTQLEEIGRGGTCQWFPAGILGARDGGAGEVRVRRKQPITKAGMVGSLPT
jgi:hypothetical protein